MTDLLSKELLETHELYAGQDRCIPERDIAREHYKRFRILNGMARVYETILPYVRPGDRVLDLCAGSGFGTQILANSGLKVVSLDRRVDCIRHRVGDIMIREIDLLADTLPDLGQFEAVVWMDGIEHFRLHDQEKILDRIKGWLLPGGTLSVNTPLANVGGPKNRYHLYEHTWEMFGDIIGSRFTIDRRYRVDFVGGCITVMTEDHSGRATGLASQVIIAK